MNKNNNVLGGVLLIAGTCIGAGMLGLPVVTAAAGFYPTLGAFLFVWFFMTCSALAYLEVSLRFHGETNLISMAGKTLGTPGKVIAWVCYLLFLYSLMAAYTAGGASMFAKILGLQASDTWSAIGIILVFVLPFAFMVYKGTSWVDRLNRILMLGLVLAFVGTCVLAFNVGVADEFYPIGQPRYLLFSLPLLATAFGYHLLIPSLKTYLRADVRKLRLTIMLGSFIPLLIYAIWELIVLNLVPTWGAGGLVQMLHAGINPADAIAHALAVHGKTILLVIVWFSFFALTTSFIGVGLGIFDFFSDGLKIHKTKRGRALLAVLTYLPPLLFAILYPHGFLLALNYAGVFAAILLIIFPVAMAWSARYIGKLPGPYKLAGGKSLLIITFVFGIVVMLADVFLRLGWFPIPRNI